MNDETRKWVEDPRGEVFAALAEQILHDDAITEPALLGLFLRYAGTSETLDTQVKAQADILHHLPRILAYTWPEGEQAAAEETIRRLVERLEALRDRARRAEEQLAAAGCEYVPKPWKVKIKSKEGGARRNTLTETIRLVFRELLRRGEIECNTEQETRAAVAECLAEVFPVHLLTDKAILNAIKNITEYTAGPSRQGRVRAKKE